MQELDSGPYKSVNLKAMIFKLQKRLSASIRHVKLSTLVNVLRSPTQFLNYTQCVAPILINFNFQMHVK
jgi:hypothetical protein